MFFCKRNTEKIFNIIKWVIFSLFSGNSEQKEENQLACNNWYFQRFGYF